MSDQSRSNGVNGKKAAKAKRERTRGVGDAPPSNAPEAVVDGSGGAAHAQGGQVTEASPEEIATREREVAQEVLDNMFPSRFRAVPIGDVESSSTQPADEAPIDFDRFPELLRPCGPVYDRATRLVVSLEMLLDNVPFGDERRSATGGEPDTGPGEYDFIRAMCADALAIWRAFQAIDFDWLCRTLSPFWVDESDHSDSTAHGDDKTQARTRAGGDPPQEPPQPDVSEPQNPDDTPMTQVMGRELLPTLLREEADCTTMQRATLLRLALDGASVDGLALSKREFSTLAEEAMAVELDIVDLQQRIKPCADFRGLISPPQAANSR